MRTGPVHCSNKQRGAYCAQPVFVGGEGGRSGGFRAIEAGASSARSSGSAQLGGDSIGGQRAGGRILTDPPAFDFIAFSEGRSGQVAAVKSRRGAGMAEFRRFRGIGRLMASYPPAARLGTISSAPRAGRAAAGAARPGGFPLSDRGAPPHPGRAGQTRVSGQVAPASAPRALGRTSAAIAEARNICRRGPGSGVRVSRRGDLRTVGSALGARRFRAGQTGCGVEVHSAVLGDSGAKLGRGRG